MSSWRIFIEQEDNIRDCEDASRFELRWNAKWLSIGGHSITFSLLLRSFGSSVGPTPLRYRATIFEQLHRRKMPLLAGFLTDRDFS